MPSDDKVVSIRCSHCGNGFRRHRILHEHRESFGNDDEGWTHYEHHQLIQCLGCEFVRYRRFTIDRDDIDSYTHERNVSREKVFPDDSETKNKRVARSFQDAIDSDDDPLVPDIVMKMYQETIRSLNAGAKTLAGGGLRATVEAICLTQGIMSGVLQKKIDELSSRNLLTASQAELLHEERYIGNAALHEMATPRSSDLEDGLGIVEGLINTIYVLPAKAKRLKKRRESVAKKKTTKKKAKTSPKKKSS